MNEFVFLYRGGMSNTQPSPKEMEAIMKRWQDWKESDAEYARDYGQRIDDMTPEPLFESILMPNPKVCLCCGQERASSLLYSPFGMQPVARPAPPLNGLANIVGLALGSPEFQRK